MGEQPITPALTTLAAQLGMQRVGIGEESSQSANNIATRSNVFVVSSF